MSQKGLVVLLTLQPEEEVFPKGVGAGGFKVVFAYIETAYDGVVAGEALPRAPIGRIAQFLKNPVGFGVIPLLEGDNAQVILSLEGKGAVGILVEEFEEFSLRSAEVSPVEELHRLGVERLIARSAAGEEAAPLWFYPLVWNKNLLRIYQTHLLGVNLHTDL